MANVRVPPFTEAPQTVIGGTPQTVVAFDFPFWSAADIVVYVDDELIDNADYSVEGFGLQDAIVVEGGYGSGAVTFNSPLTNCTVTIDRQVVGDRQSQFSRSVPLDMRALNGDLNRVTARQQDLDRRVRAAESDLADVGDIEAAKTATEAARDETLEAIEDAPNLVPNKLDKDGTNAEAGALDAIVEGSGGQVTVDLAVAATFPVSPSTLPTYSDSIGYGYVGPAPDFDAAWRTLVALRRGKTSLNYCLPGGSIMDILHPMMGTPAASRHPVVTGQETILALGFNDQRYNGENEVYIQSFKNALLAAAAWCAVPNDKKIFANDARMTKSGTWTAAPIRMDGDWLLTTVNGAYVEVEVEGSAICIVGLQQDGDGGLADISIGGVVVRSIDLSQLVGNGAALRWIDNTTPTGDTAYLPIVYQPAATIIDGLPWGRKLVRVTKTGGTALTIGAIFSNGSIATGGARVYVTTPLQVSPAGVVRNGPPYDEYTDRGNELHCQVVSNSVRQLSDAGFDVRLCDHNSVWNPVAEESSDDIHPEVEVHARMAEAMIRAMDMSQRLLAPTALGPGLIPLTLENGWDDFSTFQVGAYSRDRDGYVQLAGMIADGAVTSGTIIAILPAGCRPAVKDYYVVATANGYGSIEVNAAGEVIARLVADTWTNLSGVRFLAVQA